MTVPTGETIVAVSSPPGGSLRGIVRVSGPDAGRIASELFTPDGGKLKDVRGFTLVCGTVEHEGAAAPARLYVMRAPKSYTREDVFELHVPGAGNLLDGLVRKAIDAGARMAEPGEFTRRAFLSGRISLLQAEAVGAVIGAANRAQLRAAASVTRSSRVRSLRSVRASLVELLSLLECSLDFSEDELPEISAEDTRVRLLQARRKLHESADGSPPASGSALRAVLLGPPNSGKTTLFNALLGKERGIVSPEPGTTRDAVEATLRSGREPVRLVDTAGVRENVGAGVVKARDSIDSAAREHALAAAATGDAVLLVFDVTRPRQSSRELRWYLDHSTPEAVLVVVNKCDLLPNDSAGPALEALRESLHLDLHEENVCRTSALTGRGVTELAAKLLRLAETRGGGAHESSLSVSAAVRGAAGAAEEHIENALQALDEDLGYECVAVDVRDAAGALEAIEPFRGKARYTTSLPDEVIESVFAGFCVGK